MENSCHLLVGSRSLSWLPLVGVHSEGLHSRFILAAIGRCPQRGSALAVYLGCHWSVSTARVCSDSLSWLPLVGVHSEGRQSQFILAAIGRCPQRGSALAVYLGCHWSVSTARVCSHSLSWLPLVGVHSEGLQSQFNLAAIGWCPQRGSVVTVYLGCHWSVSTARVCSHSLSWLPLVGVHSEGLQSQFILAAIGRCPQRGSAVTV